MSAKSLIFLGTNGVLERHIEACERQNQPIAGIIDGDWFGNTEKFAGLSVLDTHHVFDTNPDKYKNHVFFVAVNWNPKAGRDITKRNMFIDLVKRHHLECINLIDPSSYVSQHAVLGQNVYIGPGTIIEPFAVIEDFATIWGNTTLGHHNRLGENSVLQREAVVHALIGSNTYVGIASVIVSDPEPIIGNNVVIAPCIHVTRDVCDNEKISLSKDSFRIYRRYNDGC